jgi:hypothetical protein
MLARTLAGGACLLVGCTTVPTSEDPRHVRAAEACRIVLERNLGREVRVESSQVIGGLEVQVFLRSADGMLRVCRYDATSGAAMLQLP